MLTFIVGESELAERIRAHHWEDTELGSPESWPESLKTLVSVMLAANQAMYVVWGPSQILLYNDQYISVLQGHHPNALGRPFLQVWREIADDLRPLVERAYAGIPSYTDDITLILNRSGYTEETHFAYSYTPVFNANGVVDGFFCPCIETTKQVNAEKALRKSDERRSIALEATQVGTFVWHVQEDRGEPDERMLALFDQPPDGTLSLRDAIATMIHPDDAQRYAEAVAESARPDGSRELREEIRVRHGQGWRWVAVTARIFFDDANRPLRMAGTGLDITERKRVELALRESEERQAFLLKLSDALRPLIDADEIQRVAARLAAEHWGMANANYVRIETRHGVPYAIVRQSYAAKGRESVDGDYPLADFPAFTNRMLAGEKMIVQEVSSDPKLTDLDKANWKAMDIGTLLSVSLVKGGRLVACFAVHGPLPRRWKDADVQLLEEIAERTWAAVERTSAEAALRESEERFRRFANASSGAIWIRNAETLAMEYVSPAIETIYGISQEDILGDVQRWAAMIVPEDRDIALAHIENARRGKPAVHEFRIQRGSDQSFRWIRDTDFPLADAQGAVERIGGIAEDVTEAKLLVEHQGVLVAELQHRVRNIMAMVRSMANRTAAGAKSVDDYRTLIEGRLLALARVQTLLTREMNVGGLLRSVVKNEIAAQAHHDGQFELTGPDVMLSPKAVEVLTLAFHELATNALKYGALSRPDGRLKVTWAAVEKRGARWLALDWIEGGVVLHEPVKRRGFGSELVEGRIPYELGGSGRIIIAPEGARCHLEFPLKDGESILETDAPTPTVIFGGTLDMTGAPDLTGRTVLVVEDDYYQAADAAAALRGAGAEILGPCSSEEMVREALKIQTPTHAVLDLNLGGGGPRFEIAQLLQAQGVPFVFLTGYDSANIPDELKDVVRLQKPVELREVVEAVSEL
jgi:PAS domain S-box-containing protein